MHSENILIYVTFPTKKIAKKTAEKLIDKKMVACVNIRKHTAIYDYLNKKYEEKEYGCFFKTKNKMWDEVRVFILKKHPYEEPVILKINIDEANAGFNEWINKTVN